MKKETGKILLGDKEFKATEIGYESYETQKGELLVTTNNKKKTFTSTMVKGIEIEPK